MSLKNPIFALLFLNIGVFGYAQDSTKRPYNIFNPTPKNQIRSFETDRPDVTESAYTVDAGHCQYEADIFNTTQSKTGNRKSVENNFNTANVKLGITNNLDVQFVVNSFTIVKVTDGNILKKDAGFGGVTFRAKQNIFGNNDGKTALAIIPFVDIFSKLLGSKVSYG